MLNNKNAPFFFKTLLFVFLFSNNSYGQVNFIHLRIYPATCGDLPQLEECFTSLDSSSFDLILKRKILKKEAGVLEIVNVPIPQNEINLLDSLLFDVYNKMKKEDHFGYLSDTSFYIEFIRGGNQEKKNSLRIGGIVNCIIFFDRIKERIKLINDNSYLIKSLKNNQETLMYDRLCKCSKP